MLLIPPVVKAVAKAADRKSLGGRFATGNVHVRRRPDGGATVTATDTHILVAATMPAADADKYDAHPRQLGDDGVAETLVPADAFTYALADAEKAARRAVGSSRLAAVRIDRDAATVVTLNGKTQTIPADPSRFPPTDAILKDAAKTAPAATLTLKADDLHKLLGALLPLLGDDNRIALEFRGVSPVVVRTASAADGVESVVGLIMPAAGAM